MAMGLNCLSNTGICSLCLKPPCLMTQPNADAKNYYLKCWMLVYTTKERSTQLV